MPSPAPAPRNPFPVHPVLPLTRGARRPADGGRRLNEAEVIAAARRGEERAFQGLYVSNVDRVFRVIFRMVGEESFASDLTQETFIRAFERLDQFRGEATFSNWLHRIAVSVALRRLKAKRESVGYELVEESEPAMQVTPPEPDLQRRLHVAIDELSEVYRTVFLMHDLEGYTHGEIAEALGVAVGTSKARLSRARAKLRELLGNAMREYVQ